MTGRKLFTARRLADAGRLQAAQKSSTFYAEQAKIELSSDDSANIAGETGVEDSDGEEIYLDVAIERKSFSAAIDELITRAIETAWATLTR